MRRQLRLHQGFRCAAVRRIDVDIDRPRPGALALRYVVTGAISELYLPPVTAPARVDELWRRTCFEAFVRPSPGEGYFEFNFAPSTQWAAYRFSGYRADMSALDAIAAPGIEPMAGDDTFELRVWLDLGGLPGDTVWRLGLSAVIEETGGRKSYWALAHPPGAADFHHAEGFAYEIPPVESA